MKMKKKFCSVPFVYGCTLWFICVINNAVFSIFHISMYFYVEVRAVPFVQFILRYISKSEHNQQ